MLTQAGHRLLVSPWFAAGAGVVIATGVMIYTPHTNFAIDIQKCQLVSCTKLAPQGAAPLQAGPGAPMPAPSRASVPADMTFWYQPVNQSTGSGFGMWIAIRYPHSVSQWQLSVVIKGATGLYVYYWPRWQAFGTDGVTVSSLVARTESAGYAEISAHDAGNDGGFSPTGYLVLFQVRGKGTPRLPTECTYMGSAHCTFKLSSTLAQPGGQGSG
jgi:hypothetical protein